MAIPVYIWLWLPSCREVRDLTQALAEKEAPAEVLTSCFMFDHGRCVREYADRLFARRHCHPEDLPAMQQCRQQNHWLLRYSVCELVWLYVTYATLFSLPLLSPPFPFPFPLSFLLPLPASFSWTVLGHSWRLHKLNSRTKTEKLG